MTVEQSVSGVILSLERTPIAPASTAANTLSSSHRELNAITGTHKGAGVMSPEVLGILLCGLSRVSRDVLEPRGLSLSRLTTQERQVLGLIAQGHATQEVARELCYSERTVKNVLHDVVTKLGARSRSHAVADAVRQGLI